ncbi:MAG: response regulator transcription factor [Desulfosalsimonadaceae bacterium]
MNAKKRNRVMIADDEAHVRRYIGAIMKDMNSEIAGEAKDGREAVEMFARLKPNLLLLDINMPVKSGKTALQEIISRFPRAFVIMLTSLADRETIEDCLSAGASGFIRKDVSIDEFKTAIKQSWHAYKNARQAANA